MIAALFIDPRGPYANRPDIDAWDESRDARKYAGPYPVVAHPPCERWGRYWSGGPSVKERKQLGDDGGCFRSALASVTKYGGVLEHPEASHAFAHHGLKRPPKSGGWLSMGAVEITDSFRTLYGWVCCVEQGHYGHPARKATWLFYVGEQHPPELIWGPSEGVRLDEGFHSAEERREARARGQKPVRRLSTMQNLITPVAFAKLLISLAQLSRASAARAA